MNRNKDWFLFVSATRGRVVRGLPGPGQLPQSELLVLQRGRGLRKAVGNGAVAEPATERAPDIAAAREILEQDELAFIHDIYTVIEAHRLAGDFDRLTIFATPRMLALLQREMPHRLKPMIAAEHAKDLTGIPEAQLPEVLRRELGLP